VIKVISCIALKHNLWLVLLAAAICALSVSTTLQVFERGLKATGRHRPFWLTLAGVVGGSGVWATHFVAMLAYSPSLPINYRLFGTAASLLIGMVGAAMGFHVAAEGSGRPRVGGALVGLSIVAMHYSGIAAIDSAFRLHWDYAYVMASIVVSVGGSAAALWVRQRWSTLRARIGAGALLLLAIVGLHFTGMTAVKLIPDLSIPISPELISRPTLAAVVGGMVFMILFAALTLIVIEAKSSKAGLDALQIAFQGVPSGVALYSPSGHLVLWNSAFESLLKSFGVTLSKGMVRAEVMRATVDGAASGSQNGIALEVLIEAPLDTWEGEVPDGRWFRVERKVLADGSIVTVMSEVTNLRRWAEAMEDARLKAEAASQAKSDFLANMSHEIRTPLNGVLGMIQAVERDELTPKQRQRIEVAHESGMALLGTLNDILDVAKVQAGRMELESVAFDARRLGETVCAAFAGAASMKGLTLDFAVSDAAEGWWRGDAMKLRQVLSNLISNAIKFTDAGGVTLRIGLSEEKMLFSVADTGVGIDPNDAERLFEKFAQADSSTTRKFGGTGLGLTICREMTELMGGRIWIESQPGEGAVVTLAFGLERTEAPEAEATATAAVAETMDGDSDVVRVLVAEDNLVNQMVLRSLLEPVNAVLTVVDNGRKAVAALESGHFDVVLMDVQMPEMNGVEATRAIRDRERRDGATPTPIIAVTANVMPEQLAEYFAAGMDGYVAKPIQMERLYAALSAALEEERRPDDQASSASLVGAM